MEIHKVGIFVMCLALVIFTALTFKIMGWWCLIVGPAITIYGSRPVVEGGGWAWERRVSGDNG